MRWRGVRSKRKKRLNTKDININDFCIQGFLNTYLVDYFQTAVATMNKQRIVDGWSLHMKFMKRAFGFIDFI